VVLRRLPAVAALACGLAGCTAVPFDAPRTATRALPPEGTHMAASARRLTGGAPDRVALVPLVDGNDALGARLDMIEAARRSIDIKTFLIKPDRAGTLFWLELYKAAERGVRVRLLFDDVFTTAQDNEIAQLDAHPNVEIRVFNPLSRNSSLAANFLLDFDRVNRRMHNKMFIADGAMAIVGGRNIADEYYQINTSHEFADFDLFVAGEPVRQMSEAFDLYWSDDWSVPFSAIDRTSPTRRRWRSTSGRSTQPISPMSAPRARRCCSARRTSWWTIRTSCARRRARGPTMWQRRFTGR
jgi:putative cardiolipin synthase